MADQKEDETEPVTGAIIKAVPEKVWEKAYDDALRPLAEQVGTALGTAGLVGNALLMPLRIVAESLNNVRPKLTAELTRRLEGTESGAIQPPPAPILIPAIEGYVLNEGNNHLQAMFLNLIASSMDTTHGDVHPSYAEVIKQLSLAEAKILQSFYGFDKPVVWRVTRNAGGDRPVVVGDPYSLVRADCGLPDPVSIGECLTNLKRLAIIAETSGGDFGAGSNVEITRWIEQVEAKIPFRLEAWMDGNPLARSHLSNADSTFSHDPLSLKVMALRLTPYGRAFCLACVGKGDPRGLWLPSPDALDLY